MNRLLAFVLLLTLLGVRSAACAQSISLHPTSLRSAMGFAVAADGKVPFIITDTADAKVVQIAAGALSGDIRLVTGVMPGLGHHLPANVQPIIIGTLGQAVLIDALAAKGLLPAAKIKGQWESFCIGVVENPAPGVKRALVIAGSDPRGTAYGVFELSKLMGVSPWVWWADAKPKTQKTLYLEGEAIVSQPPSVKYRGIFINDEDWGLQPWAAKTFERETGDIGPKTYAKVFELLLRLKANLIWPAMHPSTKPFFHYPGNKQVAADYAIVVGSSHAEPMLRNNVGEWDKQTMGDFNYLTNKEGVYRYWEQRVKESGSINAIYSLGMRGVHDSGMEGVKSAKEAVPLLEGIFADQRGLLKQYINKEVTAVPQAFTAYKEVLDIYDNNLKVPDDVTIVWPDDNYGYIQRLNGSQENGRRGGAGVYYHASYWGRPHDYLWLGTAHPGLMREEMMKAYDNKANTIWVLNVGDIKPIEYSIQFFLDMAYNAAPFHDSRYTRQHLQAWVAGLFGKPSSAAIAQTLWQYYQLAFQRRPEFMGWSQTEPTTPTRHTGFRKTRFGDEAQQRIDAYDALERSAQSVRKSILPKDADAFYQLVYYPVVCASYMNKKFLYHDKSVDSRQDSSRVQAYAKDAEQAYNNIVKETEYYNNQLARGKWKGMMSMSPRGLPVYQPINADSIAIASLKIKKDSADRIADLKIAKDFADESMTGGGRRALAGVKGFVERNGVVSMFATHYSSVRAGKMMRWQLLTDLGYTGASLQAVSSSAQRPDTTEAIIRQQGACVAYDFYSFNSAAPVVHLYSLPTHPLNRDFSVCYAIAVDDGPLQIVDTRTVGRSEEWKQNVLRNNAIRKIPLSSLPAGKHTLKVYSIDPGVILDRIVIAFGSLDDVYGVLSETIAK